MDKLRGRWSNPLRILLRGNPPPLTKNETLLREKAESSNFYC